MKRKAILSLVLSLSLVSNSALAAALPVEPADEAEEPAPIEEIISGENEVSEEPSEAPVTLEEPSTSEPEGETPSEPPIEEVIADKLANGFSFLFDVFVGLVDTGREVVNQEIQNLNNTLKPEPPAEPEAPVEQAPSEPTPPVIEDEQPEIPGEDAELPVEPETPAEPEAPAEPVPPAEGEPALPEDGQTEAPSEVPVVGELPEGEILEQPPVVEEVEVELDNPIEADEDGTVAVFAGNPIDFIFPSEIQGQPVTIIGASAFKGCAYFKTITIPACIEEIGEDAFADCSNLEKIILLGRADTEDMTLGENWSGDAEVIYGLTSVEEEIEELPEGGAPEQDPAIKPEDMVDGDASEPTEGEPVLPEDGQTESPSEDPVIEDQPDGGDPEQDPAIKPEDMVDGDTSEPTEGETPDGVQDEIPSEPEAPAEGEPALPEDGQTEAPSEDPVIEDQPDGEASEQAPAIKPEDMVDEGASEPAEGETSDPEVDVQEMITLAKELLPEYADLIDELAQNEDFENLINSDFAKQFLEKNNLPTDPDEIKSVIDANGGLDNCVKELTSRVEEESPEYAEIIEDAYEDLTSELSSEDEVAEDGVSLESQPSDVPSESPVASNFDPINNPLDELRVDMALM